MTHYSHSDLDIARANGELDDLMTEINQQRGAQTMTTEHMYTITVRYWSDHTGPHSVNKRTNYQDAMAFWRSQCRAHQNADVTLYAPDGHKMKSKDDSWPHEYGSKEQV